MVVEGISVGFWAFAIGFLSASIASGPVTFLVFHNALHQKYHKAFLLILGAALMDVIYCGAALTFVGIIFSHSPRAVFFSKIFSTLTLFCIGLYLILNPSIKKANMTYENLSIKQKTNVFFIGFLLIAINPSVILTWSVVIAMLISLNAIALASVTDVFIFVLSAGIGIIAGGGAMILFIKTFRLHLSDRMVNATLKLCGVAAICVSLYFLFELVKGAIM